MNIEIINGKRYIEFKNTLIVIITAIVCLCIFLGIFLYIFIVNIDAVQSDPLTYGVKMYNISYCYCYTSNMSNIYVDKRGISLKWPENLNINYNR